MLNLDEPARSHLAGYEIVAEPAPPVARAEVARHFPISDHPVAEEELDAWVARVAYDAAGPKWWKGYGDKRRRKLLEHYASIRLAGVRAGGTYLDAAAAKSPFYKVLPVIEGVARCYRQDLNYPPGVDGDTIGCSADAIPLPDASLDGIVSHNAWEHFEGEAALGFLRESARLLKPGGRLCILPVNLCQRTEIWTSPSVWADKYRNDASLPRFDRRATIVIREEIGQRQVMRWNPAELAAELAAIPGLEFRFHFVVCGPLRMYAMVGMRV
jgi:hypothetical protein